jgi:hypothetical protein
MATRRGAKTQRALADHRAAIDGVDRYTDLLLYLRAIRADFPQEVPEGYEFTAGGVEFVTSAAGQRDVPIRSVQVQDSAQVPDGAPIDQGGVLRCQVLLSAGRRWDTLRSAWATAPAETPHVLDLLESQHAIVSSFAAWLGRYAVRRARPPAHEVRDVLNMLAYGNRGSGKTWVCMALLLALCLEIPDSVCWFVVENRPASQEDVRETFERMLPGRWAVHWQGQPGFAWRFPNGSRIYEKSADEPAALKSGMVDAVMINEAAKLPDTVYGYATARTKDRGAGGITLIPTNPPTLDKPRGAWVYRLHELWSECQAKGEWCEVETFHLDSSKNALVNRGADRGLQRLLRAISPQLASADAGGLMVLPGDRIIYAYKPEHGRRLAPDLGDITGPFLRQHSRVGRAFDYIAGVDFQAHPYIVATFFKIYPNLADPESPILWAVSDVAVKGSEDDFLDEVLLAGVRTGESSADEIDPSTVLWIGDSSAMFQNSKHDFKQPPSYIPFKNRGLLILSPTVPVTPGAIVGRNPPVGVSLGQINRFFAQDRLFLSPLASMAIKACKEGTAVDTPRGARPDRASSHSIDTLRYPIWFVEPVTRRKRRPDEKRQACHAL